MNWFSVCGDYCESNDATEGKGEFTAAIMRQNFNYHERLTPRSKKTPQNSQRFLIQGTLNFGGRTMFELILS